MNKFYSSIFLFLLVIKINSLLPPEKRQELFNKYIKKLPQDKDIDINRMFNSKKFQYDYGDDETIPYDINKVNSILDQYDFPLDFNFLEEHNITANVKNQKGCGCCWSHAATSALAYRYKLKGLDLDLSPQDGLSCYLPDCEAGNYLIDPQMNLIKNGTVTEECFPFISGDGETIPECPTTCKDGSEPKKYYSQNAFTTDYFDIRQNFYDIITLIIDILIKDGPVVSGFYVYDDFQRLCQYPKICHNTVYTYDRYSQFSGGHAVVIVGYGFMNNKFYWLIQNSWGPESCDEGFVKIEFGQVGIENIAFSEPYIEEEVGETMEIPVIFDEVSPICFLSMTVDDEKYFDNWNNSLEVVFQSDDNKRNFTYQCSVLSSNTIEKEINCYFNQDNYLFPKSTFNFISHQSLGKNNIFVINNTFIESFDFYGNDMIFSVFEDEQYFYVSQEGSKLTFTYSPKYAIDKDLPPIYVYGNEDTPLRDCKRIELQGEKNIYYLAVCEIKKNELNYFTYEANYILYNVLCGDHDYTYTEVQLLDKTKYLVYKINKVYVDVEEINYLSEIKLNAEIEGTISTDILEQKFVVFALIEYQNVNTSYFLLCDTGKPQNVGKNHIISCLLNNAGWDYKKFDNFYVLPYVVLYKNKYSFDIIINNTIKSEKSYSKKFEVSLVYVIILVLLML